MGYKRNGDCTSKFVDLNFTFSGFLTNVGHVLIKRKHIRYKVNPLKNPNSATHRVSKNLIPFICKLAANLLAGIGQF